MENKIAEALEILYSETNELGIDCSISELHEIPSALEFSRNYYAKNTPVVIRNAIKSWPAIKKWTPEYLQNIFRDKKFDVAITPNGYADGIAKTRKKEYFMFPLEEKMTMSDFFYKLDNGNGQVYYIQKQNSNFSTDFSELLIDIDSKLLNFASECFNKTADAVNFWVGDQRAITSMHKDPYDNIYCVISGYKDFILHAPHQLPYIPRKEFPIGKYTYNKDKKLVIVPVLCKNENFQLVPEKIEWVCIDPLEADFETYPQYAKAKQLKVRVNAGDILFLPNFWYHHVRQSHKCIALNYWYDMEFDSRYCYFRMLQKITENMY